MSIGFEAATRLVRAITGDDPAEGADALFIPNYVIDHRIGGGSGGSVYRAFRTGSDRPLALKVLNVKLGQDAVAKRAWRELQVLETLRLPNVPRLIDYGTHRGRMFIVTELVEGRSLKDFGSAQRRGLREAAELMAKVADAVHSLHEHGVIHRDIKPENIIIDPQGHPVIVDMGIATLAANRSTESLSPEGAPMGTPAFMAPEQARGEQANVSTRADLFSLGATACWVMTGATPFATEDCPVHEAVRRIAQEQPRHPRTLMPTMPRALAEVLAKATSVEPASRYSSAAGFSADLRRWARGEPVLAAPPTGWSKVSSWLARHPITTLVSLAVLVIILTAAATFRSILWLENRPHAIVVDPASSSQVDLVTVAGRPLVSWSGGRSHSVVHAGFLPAAGTLADDVVFIAWAPQAERRERGTLAGYLPNRSGEPAWIGGLGDVDLHPPADRPDPQYQNVFNCTWARSLDVFPDRPGLEVVAIHAHAVMSPTAIRVYDASGSVLYEVWHDGVVYSAHFLPGSGLLALAGVNSDQKWSQMGAPDVAGWPIVVFAVQPEAGKKLGFLATPGWRGTVQAAWYKFVAPVNASDLFKIHTDSLQDAPISHERESHMCLLLEGRDADMSASLIINAQGQIVSRFPSDSFLTNAPITLEDFALYESPSDVVRARAARAP